MTSTRMAPELNVKTWLNTEKTISLEALQGKVVMVVAFQILCPGCVELCLPQAKKVYEAFSANGVIVLGLHTVFEHHEAMQEASLKAFLYEYRIPFPVGIDMPSENGAIPKTMATYAMQGTPTTLLIDRDGQLIKQHFGHIPDLILGAELMSLIKKKDGKIDDLNDGTKLGKNTLQCDIGGNCA